MMNGAIYTNKNYIKINHLPFVARSFLTSRRWRIQNKTLARTLRFIYPRGACHARVLWLSLPYSCRAALIFYTFVMSLSSPYTGRAILISICRVALIVIQRSGCAHFTLPYRSH